MKHLARAIANADDKEQGEFFNELAACMKSICKSEASYGMGMQLYCMAQQLKPETAAFLTEIVNSYTYNAERCHDVVLADKTDRLRQLEKQIKEAEAKLDPNNF